MFKTPILKQIRPILYGHYFYLRKRSNTGDDFYNVLAITIVRMEENFIRYDYSVDTENVYLYLTDVPPCGLIRGTSTQARMEALMKT